MQVFFDTSVLVAASVGSHPHHAQALAALRRVADGQDRGFIGVHSIAEAYAALTRLPVAPRIHPSQAGRIIRDNVLKHFELVAAGARTRAQVPAGSKSRRAGPVVPGYDLKQGVAWSMVALTDR